ncbi:MAG: YeeE/YedE family protein [Melioribacteraceae bacterium]|nr:YeeE/YedE family protein [Melioribacteraceae bacterium]
MGPLVPDLISTELSLIIALLIGIAFGFLLEQAGFSSSKKLVGLFYGYDFTVLRVFMTAGITAMVGVIVLNHYHLIDMNIIYINPLFLWSAIVGGAIMGLGFVIGGYCPGTSICAAAIGKKDAMYFVLGSAIGVLIFIEGYPMFEGLYKAANLGNPQLETTFNIPNPIFAFLFVVIAIVAFTLVTKIERNKNEAPVCRTSNRYLAALAAVAFFIGTSQLFVSSHSDHLKEIESMTDFSDYKFKEITSDEIAIRMLRKDRSLQFIDVRSQEEFKEFALPNAILADYKNFIARDWEKIFRVDGQITVIYAEDETTEKRAVLAARDVGFDDVYLLKGGLSEFRKNILEFNKPEGPIEASMKDTYRFRELASKELPRIIEEAKPKVVKTEKTKRVLGGC